ALVQNSLQRRGLIREQPQVERALESLLAPSNSFISTGVQPAAPESDMLAFRRAEFNIIREEVNDPDRIPNLRVIPSDVPPELSGWLRKVNLVERLRETRVFYGFDRLDPSPQPLAG